MALKDQNRWNPYLSDVEDAEEQALLRDPFGGSPMRNVKLPDPVSASAKKEPRISRHESFSDDKKVKELEFERYDVDDDDDFEPKKKAKVKKVKELEFDRYDVDDDDDFEPRKKAKVEQDLLKAEAKKPKKKKRIGNMTTAELLDSFDYTLPLGKDGKRLPSLRAFARPKCNCTHIFNEVFMVIKPTTLRQIIPKIIIVDGIQRTQLIFGAALEKERGGSLRSWKCPGWTVTYDGLKPKFGRKAGYSDGRSCRSIAIEEIKEEVMEENGKVVIMKVGLTDAAIAFLKSPGARMSERGKEGGKPVNFLV